MPLLAILIPTALDRTSETEHIYKVISVQCGGVDKTVKIIDEGITWTHVVFKNGVYLIICSDDKSLTIGEKRGLMYSESPGVYSWQIDSDDDISDDAIDKILTAAIQDADCITFQEHCEMDGRLYKSNHSIQYGDWEGDGSYELWDGFHFHRTPFMKSVIKTEIAKSVPVPHLRFGEDHKWAQALKPFLKTEVHIPQDIYFYIHKSSDFNLRYGFNR